MSDNFKIFCINDGKEYEVRLGMTLQELLAKTGIKTVKDEKSGIRSVPIVALVDNKLKDIMANIYRCAKANAEKYADPDDLVAGANITAFVKVADIMLAHGLV